MAYTKKYLKTHGYLDDKTQAEEAHFTNNFSEPMVQLDPHKVMLCVAHNANTVEKDQFLNQGKPTLMKMQKFFKINDKHMIDYLKALGSKLQQEATINVQTTLETQVPELVSDTTNTVFHQLENVNKDLETLQLQQNEIKEQFKSEDLTNILNKINEFGPV